MNKLLFKMKKFSCLFAITICSTIVFSQTTTINYLTSGLSTTACNVFDPNVTINGVGHSSYAGGVTFNSTYGILLGVSDNTTPFTGTAYVISYNFNAGDNYDISITASGDNSMHLKTSVVSNLNAFATSSMHVCPSDANVPNYNTTGYGQKDFIGTNASTTYTIPQFYVSSGLPMYLVIWASGGDPSLSLDNFSISKIVITKSTPAPSLNITPATVSLTCGTTSPTTFTVNNPGGITGITNYTWNLGATPNGWLLPDGSAAPATYPTGTINTLTLTPVCGSAPKNISATVTANGNNYNTNTSTISITQPSLSINGSSTICSGSSNYSINNLPCNASVAWSISQTTTIADLGCSSCETTSVNQIGTGTGTVTLTAVISNLCGGTNVTLNKSIQIGRALTGTYSTATNTFPLQTVNFVPAGNIFAQYQWPGVSNITANLTSGSPSGTGFYSYPGGFNFTISSGQQVSVYIAGNSSVCGPVDATRTFVQASYYYLVVSPNPASNNMNVEITEVADTTGKMSEKQKAISSNTSGITKMYLYDINTGTLIKQWDFKEMKFANYSLNIAGVKPGAYLLKMERNNKTTSAKIIVK